MSIVNNSKSKWRPVALETVEFEKLASRKLKIKAKDAMRLAEKLYTDGFISYPRTETNMFAKEINLESLVRQHVENPIWGTFARALLERGLTPRNGHKSDGAHPPIHPIRAPDRELSTDESKIYELVVRHFLACLDRDAKGVETTATLRLGEEEFKATGLVITERNFLEIYIYDTWSDREMPKYEEKERVVPKSIKMNEGVTSPPSLLTEADLIGLMEKHGIGTDATHAEHIETIKNREYVGLNKENKFVPGRLGMGLVEGYNEMGYELAQPRLRCELEKQLVLISQGKADKNEVLRTQIALYKGLFIEAVRRVSVLDKNLCKHLEASPSTTVLGPRLFSLTY